MGSSASKIRSEEPRRIVGIGASAGGLESLQQLFAALPADTGCAFVVVQHLPPDFKSMMDELLARHCDMEVRLATDGEKLERDQVYLLPAGKLISLESDHLRLFDKDPQIRLSLPIDAFLTSLAQHANARGIAVILSGSGSDGAQGVQRVKNAGGIVLVESQSTAKFGGMPISAEATGAVDRVGSPQQIAELITTITSTGRLPPVSEAIKERGLSGLYNLLNTQFGVDFSKYKEKTTARRIKRRMAMREALDLEQYIDLVFMDDAERRALYRDLLIGVTEFFRDPDAFEKLNDLVIRRLAQRVSPDAEIRVWVAGCSTGEEAYSIAMLLHESVSNLEFRPSIKIIATDAHPGSLETASRGMYSEKSLANISPERRKRYFNAVEEGYQVSPDLRKMLVFSTHNVAHDAPFTKMDLITCRNLLIYLEPSSQQNTLTLMHFGLNVGGVLFLGPSESVASLGDEFISIDEHWKIYHKRRNIRLLSSLQMPFTKQINAAPQRSTTTSNGITTPQLLLDTYDQLLDKFMPPSLLVDERGCLLDSFAGAERLLRLTGRRPSTNVVDMLRGDLQGVVAAGLQRAARDRQPTICSDVAVGGNPVTLAIQPILRDGAPMRILIELRPKAGAAAPASTGSDSPAQSSEERIAGLESELGDARESLRNTVHELQTTNEELQTANEEMVTANEELQSTNEELHSLNEELYTVNAEYQNKILELKQVNADMQHLLEATDVAILFLDDELRIRRFTPSVSNIFRVQRRDIGRKVGDLAHGLHYPTLLQDLEYTLKTQEIKELEVKDENGRTFFVRLAPYRPTDENGDPSAATGVVLALTDISTSNSARDRIAELSAIVESSGDAIIGKDLDGVITSFNRGAERLYGYSASEAIGANIRMLFPPESASELDAILADVRQGVRRRNIDTVRIAKDGTRLDVAVTVSPILNKEHTIVGASTIARDIGALRRAQQEVHESEQQIRLLLDHTAEAIYGLNLEGVCTFANPACARILGYDNVNELIGKNMHALARHTDREGQPVCSANCTIQSVLTSGIGFHSEDELLWRKDGVSFSAECWSYPIRRDACLVGAVVTFVDITERKRAEAEVHEAAERRDRFLAMLSHELRNPLAAVLNATKVLGLPSADQTMIRRAQEVVTRQSNHMARLLDDLLDVVRIARGTFELRRASYDMREIAQSALESVGPLLEEHDTRLHLEIDEEPVMVSGDSARLQQVLVNLLSNAIRYSSSGSPVTMIVMQKDGQAEVSVKDEGQGIESGILPHVFDLFVQTEQSLDRAAGGLGVGLSLVKNIVKLHGGSVSAHSEGIGRGSVFRVMLPLESTASKSSSAPPAAGAPSKRVVLVEDQADSREMLRLLLEAMGHKVVEAADGAEGTHVIETEKPDIAIVDIGLPGISGYDVACQVRAQPGLSGVKLVALTGYGSASDIQKARDSGFDAHLTKPADSKSLNEILSSHD